MILTKYDTIPLPAKVDGEIRCWGRRSTATQAYITNRYWVEDSWLVQFGQFGSFDYDNGGSMVGCLRSQGLR